jgi:hypothetical protein
MYPVACLEGQDCDVLYGLESCAATGCRLFMTTRVRAFEQGDDNDVSESENSFDEFMSQRIRNDKRYVRWLLIRE